MYAHREKAVALGKSIEKLASNPDALDNFVSYLTYHFPEWLNKYANTPEGLVSEFEAFSSIYA